MNRFRFKPIANWDKSGSHAIDLKKNRLENADWADLKFETFVWNEKVNNVSLDVLLNAVRKTWANNNNDQ